MNTEGCNVVLVLKLIPWPIYYNYDEVDGEGRRSKVTSCEEIAGKKRYMSLYDAL